MTNRIEAYPVGHSVSYSIGGSTELFAEVNRVTFGRDGRVEYELVTLDKGEPKCFWVHADHVRPSGPKASFGFRPHQD